MSDSFTETTSQSWFGRIGGAIKGVIVGVVLIVVSMILLFYNEGRSVRRYKTLEEGRRIVVPILATSVDTSNEGKLIHLIAKADTDEVLADPIFGVTAQALKLKRKVEMYQWKENKKSDTKKKLGGGTTTETTYTYNKVWSDQPIQSGSFRQSANHSNPTSWPYSSDEFFFESFQSRGVFINTEPAFKNKHIPNRGRRLGKPAFLFGLEIKKFGGRILFWSQSRFA